MANSRQRKREKKRAESIEYANVAPAKDPTALGSWRFRERVSRFFEHGSLQTLLGIIGGLVGTFLDGRFFAALGIWVSYSLRRSGALLGVEKRFMLAIQIVVALVAGTVLFFLGVEVNRSKPHVFTPEDYRIALRQDKPLPITQQITNVYQTYMAPTKSLGEPRIDLSGLEYAGNGTDGSIVTTTHAVNNGTVPALDVTGTAKAIVGPFGKETEDSLFNFLNSRSTDVEQPRLDIAPGPQYSQKEIVGVNLSEQDKINLSAGQALYLGRVDRYKDHLGNIYTTEICEFLKPPASFLGYCDGHNRSRKLNSK